MYYYKDKKQKVFDLSQLKLGTRFHKNARFLTLAFLVVLVILFVSRPDPSADHIEIFIKDDQHHHNKASNKSESSLIIDALLNPSDENDEPSIPVFRLVSEFINGIYFYNIHEEIESWWPFECLKTRMKQSINTWVCIHDPKYDKHISGQLKENGLWEPTNVRSFLRLLNEQNDTNVIDIGANIGLYSLLAAKLNRHVLAVEPLHENLNRLHKAAYLEGVQSKITALVNALTNERGQVKLSIMDYNLGGTYVLRADLIDPEQKFSPTSSSVIVNGILMNDLVEVIKVKMSKAKPKRFVIKMDIEGYEPYVFEKAQQLFDTYEIVALFMEFGKSIQKLNIIKNDTSDYYFKIQRMLKFLQARNYEPYEMNGYNKLDYFAWRNDWPWDVYFKQCDMIYCDNHVYKLNAA